MSASLLSELENFSRYNRIANRLLYDACRKLPAGELDRPRAAQYGSILGTLNHVLVMDGVWLDRFTGTAGDEEPHRDAILHRDFTELRRAREHTDIRIEEFIETVSIAFLSSQFRFKDLGGQFRHDPADRLVLHMFNHQTHHRAQVHAMLAEAGIEPPALDFHALLRR